MATNQNKLKKRRKKKQQQQDNDLFIIWRALATANKHMPWFHSHTNANCLACNIVQKEMIRVGALIFCASCFNTIFDAQAPERDPEAYKKWLDYQGETWMKGLE